MQQRLLRDQLRALEEQGVISEGEAALIRPEACAAFFRLGSTAAPQSSGSFLIGA